MTDHKKTVNFGMAGIEFSKQNFDIENVKDKVLEIYNSF